MSDYLTLTPGNADQPNRMKTEKPLQPIAAGVSIGHIRIKVADLDRALAFYSGVLGFEVTQRYGRDAAFQPE